MKNEIRENIISDCVKLICDRFNVPAALRIAPPIRSIHDYSQASVFLDVLTTSNFSIADIEILKDLITYGIKSKKDYRRLHSLIRMRLIDAIYSLRNLTEESLRNLGAPV